MGAHGFSFSIMFKYNFSAKLLEISCCFTANVNVSLPVPLIGQFTDMTISNSICKEKGQMSRLAEERKRSAQERQQQSWKSK